MSTPFLSTPSNRFAMSALSYRYPFLSVVLLCSCSVAETAPPPVAVAPVVVEAAEDTLDAEPAPPPEPEVSLQERWRAPFAVDSRGRTPRREVRPRVVVRADAAPPPAAAAAVETTTVAATDAEPAARPATATPAPTASPPRAAAGASSAGRERAGADAARTHKVEWGETWYGIARRHGISPSALERANPGIDPEKIRSGQVLRIPSGSQAALKQPLTHKVGPGDSLWGIARRYGVTMEQIRAANRLRDDRVRLGQTLTIPRVEENR